MNAASLLLIEGDSTDAALFCNQIQHQLGDEVEIEWKRSLGEALAWLEAGNKPDQIWLDPELLSDLGQQGISIAKALVTLKQYVEHDELRLLGADSTSIIRAAAQQKVEVVPKQDALNSTANADILQRVMELLAKRSSGGTTARVENARLEGKIAKIEYQVDVNIERISRNEQTLIQQDARMSKMDARITQLQNSIEETQQIKLKRWDFAQTVFVALITAFVTLGTPLLPKLLDLHLTSPTTPKPSPSATK